MTHSQKGAARKACQAVISSIIWAKYTWSLSILRHVVLNLLITVTQVDDVSIWGFIFKILTVGISDSVARIGTDSGQTFGPILKLAN